MTRTTGLLALFILLCVTGCQEDSEPAPDALPDASAPQDAGNWVAAPTLEIRFNGIIVPDLALHCSAGVCTVPDDQAIDFGTVGVNREAEILVSLQNPAVCDAPAGLDPCTACALTVARNPAHQNLGIGFKAESNTPRHFRLAEPFTEPLVVSPADVGCGDTEQSSLALRFSAPERSSSHRATLVIESNDPDRSVVEIPVKAEAVVLPVAIASLRSYDPSNPSAPSTDPEAIDPMDRVYFDGRDSYQPTGQGADDTAALAQYHWEVVEAPRGTSPADFDWLGENQSLSSMWVPLPGRYVVRLVATNTLGFQSADTPAARVEFDAIVVSGIGVFMFWDHPSNDQDLHLVYLEESANVCHRTADCYFSNCNEDDFNRVHWFPDAPVSSGPNPRLDRDDPNGFGPEIISIDRPNAGSYRVYTHYWPSENPVHSDTTVTVQVYLKGVLAFEEERLLDRREQVWAAVDIEWVDDDSELGSGSVTPYPSDDPDRVGRVAGGLSSILCSSDEGWPFPD